MTVAAIRRHTRRASATGGTSTNQSSICAGKLPDAQGVVVARALDLFAHERLPNPEYHDSQYRIYDDYEARSAAALTRMASQALGAETSADRATVVIHVAADHLTAGEGDGHAEEGPALPAEIVRRFACDGRLQPALEDAAGRVIGVGRASRSIPVWLSRQIKMRDIGCRCPGFERTRWVHRHHIQHWADGGPTDLSNLITLCGFHHRLVHEGGWALSGDPDGDVDWVRPSGAIFNPKPYDLVRIRLRLEASKAGNWLPARVRGSSIDDTS